MAYKMDCDPHGFCIIFNNTFNGNKCRTGTGKDCHKLKELFRKLKYKVIIKENKSTIEMLHYLTEMSKSEENKDFDSFVCCFLSHGNQISIYGNDYKTSLLYTTIWSLFGEKDSTLRNKPKVFITQSCLTGVTAELAIADQRTNNDKMDIDNNLCDGKKTGDAEVPNNKFDQSLGTDHADILFVQASVPGSRALRSNEGSPFVETLYEVLGSSYTTHSLMDMIYMVISKMRRRTEKHRDIVITVPSFHGSTCKDIYFVPPLQITTKHADAEKMRVDDTGFRRASPPFSMKNIKGGVCRLVGTHSNLFCPEKCADRTIRDLGVTCENKENECRCTCTDTLENYEDSDRSSSHNEKHEVPLVSETEKSKQSQIILRPSNEEKDMKIRQLTKQITQLTKEIAVVTETVNEIRSNLEMAPESMNAFKKDMEISIYEPSEPQTLSEIVNPLKKTVEILRDESVQPQMSILGGGERLKREVEELKSKIEKLESSEIIFVQSNEEKDMKIQQLEHQLNQVTEQNTALTKKIDHMATNFKMLTEVSNALKKEVGMLRGKLSQPRIRILGICGKLKKDVEELKSKISNMQDKNQDLSKSYEDMDLKIQLQENKTLNGQLIWKIDKIDLRMAQARLGKSVALHSAPCYTKQYEYKYSTRLYLQGDGMGRSTHVSLFFVVMKSEYDQLLTWPMRKRITFELINHVNEAESVIESFVSNPKSPSFQRPTENMNVSSGCPMFISIERFLTGGFVVDNCAYIKTTVQEVEQTILLI